MLALKRDLKSDIKLYFLESDFLLYRQQASNPLEITITANITISL